jgi:methanogenic corrinoid protein MtbC1
VKSVIEALEYLGVRHKVRIMVCGAPVTDAFAKDIGFDDFGMDASCAVPPAVSLSQRKVNVQPRLGC